MHHPATALVCALSALIMVTTCPARARGGNSLVQTIASIKQSDGRFSMRLYDPMRELGMQLAEDGQYKSAIGSFRYMQNLVHRTYGVYSPRQKESVELMIHSYMNMGDYADADRQHEFLYNIALHSYGADDASMNAARRELADWYRNTLRYNKALRLYLASQHVLEKHNDTGANLIDVLRSEAMTLYLAGRCCASDKLARANQLATSQAAVGARDKLSISLEYADTLLLKNQPARARAIYRTLADKLGQGRQPNVIGMPLPRDVMQAIKVSSGRFSSHAEQIYIKQTGSLLKLGKPRKPLPAALGSPMLLCSAAITELLPFARKKLSNYYADVRIDVDRAGTPLQIVVDGNAPAALKRYLRAALKRSYYRPAITDDGRVTGGTVSFRETFNVDDHILVNDQVASWSKLLTLHTCTIDRLERS